MRLAAAILCIGPACCAPAPGPAAKLTMADIKGIVTALAYREEWGRKCGDPTLTNATMFMTDLNASGAPATLLSEAQAEIDRVTESEKATEAEYVCTVELTESTEKNAAAAQAAWAALKKSRS